MIDYSEIKITVKRAASLMEDQERALVQIFNEETIKANDNFPNFSLLSTMKPECLDGPSGLPFSSPIIAVSGSQSNLRSCGM